MTVFEVAHESGTYHTRRDCPALRRGNRYWPVDERAKPSVSDRPRGGRRRLCKLCAAAGQGEKR